MSVDPKAVVNSTIQMLYDYGYFFSPEALQFGEVLESDLPNLKLNDNVVVMAASTYQKNFQQDFDELSQKYHHRYGILDGDIGPATRELLKLPRCGMPDYQDPNKMMAAEQAKFGRDCQEAITTSHNMKLTGLTDEELDQIWVRAGRNWQEVLDVAFSYQKDRYPNTHIYAFEAPLGGSVLADQILNVGGCSQRLRGRFDNRNWTVPLNLATTTHEWGHALGYGHVTNDRQAIMYPSIHQAGMSRGGKPNESDVRAMTSLGYRRRTTPIPDPDKPDTPTTGTTIVSFSLPQNLPKGTRVSIVTGSSNDGGWNI